MCRLPRYELVSAGRRYYVRRLADGARVSPLLSHPELAANALDRLERENRQRQRACLRCGAGFLSDGPHNRLCDHCRGRYSGLDAQMLAVDGLPAGR